ncbi:MAG: glucuronate isomerase [Angelakisella sp.]
MRTFMDEDFLLETATSRTLYHNYAEKMPIVDYHCHINPTDIATDKQYSNITELWLGGDHYKWRTMRACGVPESEITGCIANDPYTVFAHWAQTLPRLAGNPLYHWTYLELKRYFGEDGVLDESTAKEIYSRCNKRLATPDMSVRGIIEQSNVRLICTTDDPLDDLCAHEQLACDATCCVKVLPAFRPDKAMNADKPGFAEYIAKLEQVCGCTIDSFDALRCALDSRIDFFEAHGCRASDHALERCIFSPATPHELDSILRRALVAPVCEEDGDKLKTALLLTMAKQYRRYGWVMQLHFGCIRNNSTKLYTRMGPDVGFDAVGSRNNVDKLALLLDTMEQADSLPRTILYSLNQNDNDAIAAIAGCFQNEAGIASKVQLGSAWWFNDHKKGMEKQLTDLAATGVLANFVGMLTDSRSFLSYTRHEYFRRILCNLLGSWVESGEYINDMEMLGGMVQDICYNNAVRFFGFKL